jgi:hypothetical protein
VKFGLGHLLKSPVYARESHRFQGASFEQGFLDAIDQLEGLTPM